MRDQIFLSHAHEDKELVGIIAEALRNTFSEDKVFYDSWSMRPGENFIEGMGKGLERCEYFFLFMSEISLGKPMVRLEWHNGLLNSLNDKSHFIPVRMDNIQPPAILMTTLYLDMYNRGLPQTIEDIKSIIYGRGLYNPSEIRLFQNLFVRFRKENDKIVVTIGAKRLVEHDNTFAFWTSNNVEPFVPGMSETAKSSVTIDGIKRDVRAIRLHRPLTPHTPNEYMIKSDTPFELEIYHVLGNQVFLVFSGNLTPSGIINND